MDSGTQGKEPVAPIDLISVIRDIAKDWIIILSMSLTVSFLSYIWVNETCHPIYSSSTTFAVTYKGLNNNIYQNLSSTTELATRFSKVLESTVLQKKVCEELALSSFDATTTVSQVPETNLLILTVQSSSSLNTYRIITSIIKNYNTVSDYVIEDVIMEVIQEPEIPTLSGGIRVKRTMEKAFFFTAISIGLLIAIFSYLRDTIKNAREVTAKLDARLLGTICHERKRNIRVFGTKHRREYDSMLIRNPLRSFRYVEGSKLAASRVRIHMDKHHAKVLLVTSVMENEGKSTVAANLALAIGQEKKVMLIDCDFKKPAQYKIFDAEPEKITNLVDVLEHSTDMERLIQSSKSDGVFLILNATAARSTDAILENGKLERIIQFCKEKMDYVIVDTSPMALVSDAEELAQFADASLLVVREDMVLAKDINDAIDALNNTKGKVLGCIFNDASQVSVGGHYGYGSHYGYGRYGGEYAEQQGIG
jgi:capsular exopolysaccharide synthesis family protein